MKSRPEYKKQHSTDLSLRTETSLFSACLSLLNIKRKKLQQLSLATLGFIVVLSLVTTSGFSALLSTSAYASSVKDYSPEQEIASLSYREVLNDCIHSVMKQNIQLNASDNREADPTKWFDNLNGASGYIYPDGKVDCYTFAPRALSLWGYSNQAFLQALGYSYNNNTAQWNGPDGDTRSKNFQGAINLFVYGVRNTDTPTLSGAAKYVMALHYFTDSGSVCKAHDLGTYDSISTGSNKNPTLDGWLSANGGKGSSFPASNPGSHVDGIDNGTVTYQKVTVVNSGKNTEVHGYAYNSNNQQTVSSGQGLSTSTGGDTSVNEYGSLTNPTRRSCVDLTSDITSNAGAYKVWLNQHTSEPVVSPGSGSNSDASNPTGDAKTSCGIEGIGWIVCPLLGFIGTIADSAFSFLSTSFLETKSSIIADPSVVAAWSTMRNIANVAFVIAFLFIIFSQLTGQGVSNYGVKKLLPRIVVAAILVNISFFICQIAVDLSNILGYSLNKVIGNAYVQISGEVSGGDATGNGLGIAAIVAGIVAGSVGLALAVTGPVILAAVLALMLIVLILVARTALIVLLVVVAPLAFVAYLLPNTEDWFKKWYKMFFALLIVFPVISVVFGASSLAAKVIKDSSSDPLIQVIAIGVAALPLVAVPALLQGSLKAAGAVGARLSGASSKMNGKVSGSVKEHSKLGQIQQFRGQQAKIRRAQILGGTYKGSGKNPLNWGRNASSAINNQINQNTGKFGTEQSRLGERINAKIEAEEVTAASATINKLGLDIGQLAQLGRGETVVTQDGRKVKADTATQKAAISSVIQTGDHDATRSLIDTVGNSSNTSLRSHLADALASSSNRPGYVGGAALGQIRTGGFDSTTNTYTKINTETLAQAAIKNNTYSAEKIVGTDKKELDFVHNQLGNTNITTTERAKIISNAQDVLTDEVLNKKISKNATSINAIARHP